MVNDFDGLLGDERAGVRDRITERFENLFALCGEVNRSAHTVRNSIPVGPDDPLHLTIACLLQKAIDSFQSVVVLAELGLEPDANTLLRTALKATLIIRRIAQDPAYAHRYTRSGQRHSAESDRDDGGRRVSAIDAGEPQLSDLLRNIDADIAGADPTRSALAKSAEECGLAPWYQLVFRTLCLDEHTPSRSLDHFLARKWDGRTELSPGSGRLKAVLVTACSVLLTALTGVDQLLEAEGEHEEPHVSVTVK